MDSISNTVGLGVLGDKEEQALSDSFRRSTGWNVVTIV